MKALIVAKEAFDLTELSEGFTRMGFEVATAPSATFALSFLERYHPDVTICMDDLEDMSGTELHGIVREDPSLNDIAFVLLVARNVYESKLGNQDLVLSTESSISKLARLATRQVLRLQHNLIFERDQKATQEIAPSIYPNASNEQPNPETLQTMSPEALLIWLTDTKRNGRLEISNEAATGELHMLAGQPSHAEFKNNLYDKRGQAIHKLQNGEQAAKHVLGLLTQKPEGLRLSFESLAPTDPQLRNKITIRTSLAELMTKKARA